MPAFRHGKWDGKIRLVKKTKGGSKIHCGLANAVEKFAKKNEYSFSADFSIQEEPTPLGFSEWYNGDEEISPHHHQKKAIFRAVTNNRQIFISPTGSGKSLIIYTIARFLLQRVKKKILILVPTISLVEQLYSDFQDYSETGWTEQHVTKLHSKTKIEDRRIVISTWQSMTDAKKNHFEAVIGDECHLYKSKEISKLLENMNNAKYRYGFTGTLDDNQIHHLVLQGLFGPIYQVTTTSQLIEEKKLSDVEIKCMTLIHKERDKQKFDSYEEEIKFLLNHTGRTKIIADLAKKLKGTTLILFSRIDTQGKILYNMLSGEDKTVFYIDGSTPPEEREKIRKKAEELENVIILGSSQIVSTGINIKSLKNIIFAYPSKSRIRTLQSIGRSLRVSDKKDKAYIYDVADDLTFKGKPNYTWNHFIERLKIYTKEEFDYKIIKLEMEYIIDE